MNVNPLYKPLEIHISFDWLTMDVNPLYKPLEIHISFDRLMMMIVNCA